MNLEGRRTLCTSPFHDHVSMSVFWIGFGFIDLQMLYAVTAAF